MIGSYFNLAFRNIQKRGARSWLTMIGIFIGIAAVVSLISLGNGLQSAVTGQFSRLDPDKLIVQNAETGFGPPGSTAVSKLNEHDKELLESVNGVDEVVQRLVRVVRVEYNEAVDFSYVANIPEEKKEIDIIYDALNLELESGRLLTANDRRKVILGSDFADPEKFDKEIKVGKKINIQGEDFEVLGILKKAGTFQLNSIIIMPDKDMRRILEIGDEFDILVVQIQDQDELDTVSSNIEKKLRSDRKLDVGEEDFSIQTPQQSVQTINTVLGAINIVIAGIAAISLLVGGIGITNTMYTSVLERRKEIGIMKSVGAKNKDVLLIFLVESALLGLVGGIIGAIIGLGLAYLAAFAVSTALPGLNFAVSLNPALLSLAVGFSFAIGALSGIIPAYQASRLNPVEALRS